MVKWSPQMIDTLQDMRARGAPLFLCAEKIGVGYATAVYKARELGIAGRMNSGRRAAWKTSHTFRLD